MREDWFQPADNSMAERHEREAAEARVILEAYMVAGHTGDEPCVLGLSDCDEHVALMRGQGKATYCWATVMRWWREKK